MAKGFNLTAELNLRGPNNLRTVVSNIKKQVGSITANITPTVNRSNIKTIATDIRSQLGNIRVPLSVTVSRASIQNISRDIRSRLSGIDIPVSVRVNRSSLTAARKDINKQLGNVNANVNITISPTATRNAAGLNRNLTVLNQSLNQTTTSATNAAAAIQSFAAAMRGAAGTNIPRNINIGLNTAGANAANATANVRQLGGEIENFGRQAGLAIRRFAAFTTVTSVFYGLARSIQSGITAFVDFDRELVRISQVTGDNIRDVNKLASTVTNLATTYGVSSRELAGVSLTLAQAGLTAKETERALKALALSALAPSFDDLNSTVEGSIALMRQFGISTNQLEGALGSINSVAAKFAVEASDIIAAIQRTGGVFAAASKGVSEGTDALNEFVAVFTSIRATTRESAETIATGLRTIFTRIQRGPTIEALKQFGVNLTDVEGKFVGAYKAVQLLSEGLTRLDPRDLRFSQIVEELGGFRQIGKVIPLIQEFATAQEALKVAQAGSGSLAEDAAKGQLALAVQISKVREEFLSLIRSVGDTSSFRTLVKLGLDLASSLIQVADAAKELIPLIGIFTAIRGAQALTRFGAGFVGGVRGAPARGFASGGYVPGVGNSDTVPAMLTPGEFVIRKKAVKTIGVSRLASLNRNNGGPIPTQYFEDGGPVQRFTNGGAPRKGIDWKSLSKGRGKKGARGPRARFELPQPGEDTDFAKWQRQIYAEYDADPSLPRIKYNGIPMPPEIAYANKLISEEVFRQNFGSSRRKKSGKLKKTPLGLIFSAAKMPRGPRAPAGEMEKIMAGYQSSPEFQKQTSGAGSSLFASLKGPLSSFKKGGTFGGVIAPGSETATKIKDALGRLLAQSSGQDAVKAKTALDKFDSFIAGATPEKAGHVSHFTWAMNQIFKKGIATFGRGGRASSRMGVFDFDMTTGITKQKETPSLSGFRNPTLAVPDILSATPTGLVELMKRYGASQILSARSGGPRGEMRGALGTFFKKNGVLLPSSRITTLGDQVDSLSTPEKKARALYAMVKKYGSLDFFDDDQTNIDAAKMVRGVSARKVSVMKNLGGVVQKFAQKTPTINSGLVEPLSPADQKLLDDLRAKFGIDNVALTAKGISIKNSDFEGLSRATKVGGLGQEIVVPFKELGKKNFVPFKKRKGTTYSSAQEQLISSILSARNQYIQQREISATEARAASLAEQQGLVERVKATGKKGVIVGLRGDTKEIADRSLFTTTPDATIKLDNKIKKRLSGFETEIVRGALPTDIATIITKDIKKTIKELVGRIGTTISRRARVTGTKGDRSISRVIKKQMAQFEGLAFESGLAIANLNAGGRYSPKWNAMDFAMGLEKDIAELFGVPANVAADAARQATQETARKKVQSGQITRGLGVGGEVARIRQIIATRVARQRRVSARTGTKVQSKALGGEIKGISSSRAREAILGKQLNGVEMIKAARKAGYDIEELDDGMIQLSRNNKVVHTLTRAKASELLGSMSTGYNLGGSIQKFAKGGSSEDTVPALLTPGEFVINKRAAKRLGSSKLNRLNRADRISGFNSGGPVGNIQSYSSGGDVQRFFFGGGARARPGTEATSQNLMISGNVMTQLREITTALQELGVASSNSADLIRRGGRISVQAANAAYEADILRMRVAGAPMQTVIEAEQRLANMRQQAQTQIRAQRQLSGVGGAQLENIDTAAQQRLQQLISRRQASGLEVDEAFMRRAEGAAYTRAARQEGLSPTQTAGLTGNDLRQYINTAMGDPRTFEQMNRQFEARRRQEILAQINAERGATTDRREIANRVREASRLAAEETNIRRQTLNQTRGTAGPGAAGGQRMQQGMFMASFALPMLAQMVAGDPTKASSAGGAAMSAGIQGAANTAAMGTMIASMFPPGLGQGLAFAATAAASVGQAFIDARNATIEFEKNLAAKKVEFALEDTGKLFEKLSKDIKDIDVQNAIGQKLIQASTAAQRAIEVQATTAKAFWVNMFDAFGGGTRAERSESAQRGQILEQFGTMAYLRTTQIGQSFMGGSGTAEQRANVARASYTEQMIPEQARNLSKQFSEIASGANRLLEEKIRSGLKIEEYINTDEFKKLSETIALSNATIAEQVLRIRNSIVLTDAQKTAQERLIIATFAEEDARKRAAIVARDIQLREVQKATNQLSRSLERMFQNMEQAISKTNFGLEKMARDLDLVSSSLTGQAKAGEGAIRAINVLQNPRAYGSAEVSAARGQAAGFFGGSSDIVKGLLTLGDDIEATIMGTINRTVMETEGDSPAKIAIAIEKSVRDKLASLELPQDVSEKLAREVKVALEQIRKEGDEKADFTQIEEKLKDLGRVLESTRRAQEVALKVLENWQNSLNSYTSSINTLTDLQIDFAARLRKSAELVINSQTNLARTLGRDISIENLMGNRNALIGQQTGGATAPGDIFRNINRLEAQRRQQEGAVDVARQGGPGRMKDFMIMSNNLKLTNVALRENYDALRNLAENSDIAAAALNKIQEAQQRQQGKVGFIEKLVTSTPEEFESLNRAFIRLQNNANGQINTINNSVGAQKAYIEAIQNGATAMEAMRAAQTAFANERRDTLSALNDLLPFLGGGQQANQIRANTLESMLMESGIGVSPMFQEVLNALRNPELDPETQRAITLYQEANQLQVTANNFLNQINNKLQEETAEKAARAIADALANTILTFKNAEQGDLNRGVVPQNRATGGIIYASNGAFAPRGTDTVPAMLTPGEFVVNKNATAKNLPLLKSINSQKFNGGGKVKYYAGGGFVSNYLSADAISRADFQQTKDEFLDVTQNQNLFDPNVKTALYRLPSTYIRKPEAGKQTPDQNGPAIGRYDDVPNKYNLKNLYPDSGDIVPGYVTSKIDLGAQYFIPPSLIGPLTDLGRVRVPLPMDPSTKPGIILGLNSKEDLKTTKYSKKQFTNFKQQLEKLDLDRFNWINNPASFTLRALQNITGEYPTDIEPTNLDNRYFNPNSKNKYGLVYASDTTVPPLPTPFQYSKIFTDRGDYYGITTGGIGQNPSKPVFTSGPDLSQDLGTMSGQIWDIDKAKVVSVQRAKDLLDYHSKQFSLINKTVKAAKNNFKDVALEDSPDIKDYNDIQNKFSNLYTNLSPYETFDKTSLFAGPMLENARSLIVASSTPQTRSDILKYIERQQGQLAPGQKPDVSVGILDALPIDLANKTKDWVKKIEFDIFPEDGGAIKKFPFLVNANIADLGKGFEERAKEALLNQKNKISQETVFDNNKLRLTLGIGKNIDLPYSATYTKYSGPLWNTITKSFSEDPNDLLSVFLPEDKNIFSGLDITNQRLYSRQPFDISSFASSSIPDDPINKLIDLVKNNGDKNLIDQAKNQIIQNSTLTFPHKDRKVAGSLIKLQNAIGQQIFSGYSELPSTTFSFGEFLADAVVDYAKQAKQQAGVAAGKVADDKLGQEVIGDVPMETVRVLQQLSQGALQVFGRRPVPGLPRGWLFNNIRSLQGILPRGGRSSIDRLANNDQAKAAANIIRNVISNAGAYVSNIAGRTNNPQLYNGLKDTYGLMWGAYKAFDSISKSDTRNLAQLLKTNPDAETIFRTLGASATFEKAAASSLSEDYKAILGNQLAGSKITTVGADGRIMQVNPADAPPPKIENYSDLMNLALNPYNEFSSRSVRSGIFDKLIADISSAVDNRGMPYFEPNTSNFLISSLDSLKKWYGGDGAWLGQDYLFDKAANPDPANRGQQFLQNLDAGRGVYDMANMAHNNLGGSVKFGNLPGDIWFKNRVEAGNFATGGMVYAAGGTMVNFQPRGTDTVPAMLTPGEFVVNRAATQKHLPLLKSINSNTYMADGGLLEEPKIVQGVKIPGRDNLSPRINRIDKNIGINTTSIQTIDKNIVSIQDSIDKLSSGQKMLTGSLDSLKDLQKQILVIADMVMKTPEAIYGQVLVTLRQLWNNMGPLFQPWVLNNGWPAAPFNKGGPVYASNGQLINFQPKGTDTVPAMLTPGEFVVNRAATQKNLPLLKTINDGVGGYSDGGIIYAEDGRIVPQTRRPPQRGSLGRLVPLPGVPLSRESAPTAALPKSKPEIAKPKLPNPQPSSGKDSYVDWYLKKFKDIPDIEYDDLDLVRNLGSIMNDKNAKEFGLSRSIISQGRIDFAGKTKSDIYKLIDSLLLPKISSARRIADLEYPEKIRSQGPGPMGLRGGDLPVGLPPGTSGFGLAEGSGGLDDSYGGRRERYYRFIAITLSELNKEGIARVRSALKSVADFEYLESTDPLFEYRRDSSTNMTGIMNSRVNDYSSIFDLEYLLSEAQAKQNKQISQAKIKSITDYISNNTDEGFGELPLQQAIDQTAAAYQKYNKYIQDVEDGVVGLTRPVPPRPDSNLNDSSPFSVIRILDGLIDDHQNVFEFLAKTPEQKAQYQFSRATILAKTKLFDLLSNNYISDFGGRIQTDSEERADFSVSRFGRNDVKTSTPNQPLRKWISLDGKKSVIGKMASIVDNTNTKNPVDYIEFLRAKRDNSGLEKVLVNIFKFSKFDQEYIHRVASSLQQKPNTFSSGGTVYASKGQLINFEPKGTDTVPAMLTPGEFVVNRAATQKNLPLLKAINNGVGGYSDGGVVYLQAGGRPQAEQGPRRGPREKDEVEVYKRGGLKDRLAAQSADRFRVQKETSRANQNGRLWLFTLSPDELIKDKNGKLLNNGLQFLLKDANGNPTDKLTTESLAAMDISKVFSLRSNSNVNAIKEFKKMNMDPNLVFKNISAVDAVSAINKTKQQQARKSFDQRILDELSYQIQTNRDMFSIFNAQFFNTNLDVVDKYTKEMNDVIDNMDLNNPASVMAGMAALGPKVNKVKTRRDYLEEIIRNNDQAIAVLRAANLNFGDPANMRQAFEGNPPIDIHQKQIDDGRIELFNARRILDNLAQNPKVQMGLRNPLVSQAFQRLLIPTGGFGVPISTFEGGPGAVSIPQKLARGGMIYANNGQLINFQPKGSDTVPAMLTPGEFVVNRQSAQNNLPLLQAINSGLYNKGGKVSYLADGTSDRSKRGGKVLYLADGTSDRSKSNKQLVAILFVIYNQSKNQTNILNNISQKIDKLLESINKLSTKDNRQNVEGPRVNIGSANVNINQNMFGQFLNDLFRGIKGIVQRLGGDKNINNNRFPNPMEERANRARAFFEGRRLNREGRREEELNNPRLRRPDGPLFKNQDQIPGQRPLPGQQPFGVPPVPAPQPFGAPPAPAPQPFGAPVPPQPEENQPRFNFGPQGAFPPEFTNNIQQQIQSGILAAGVMSMSFLSGPTPGTEELFKTLSNFSQVLTSGAASLNTALSQISQKLSDMPLAETNQNRPNNNNGVSNTSNPTAIVDALGNRLDRFIEQLQNALPPFIRVEGQHQVNVVINGGAILQQLLSGPIGNIVESAIQSAFNKQSRKREGY